MKNMKLADDCSGWTEPAFMYATTSRDAAALHAKSEHPLFFRVVSEDFMNRAVDINWLSLYPDEREVLYPPLTRLKIRCKRKIKNSAGFVVDVTPIWHDAPDEFLCPITFNIMSDPVIAEDGYSYERSAIEDWFARGETISPKTGGDNLGDNDNVLPNSALKNRIVDFRLRHGILVLQNRAHLRRCVVAFGPAAGRCHGGRRGWGAGRLPGGRGRPGLYNWFVVLTSA
jgi:hypothetical protein